MTTARSERAVDPQRPLVGAVIRTEVTELCCEVLDLEPFEITPTTPLQRFRWRNRHPEEILAATLACAFGVRLEAAKVRAMVDLERVGIELERSLRKKRQNRKRAWPPTAGRLPAPEPFGLPSWLTLNLRSARGWTSGLRRVARWG